MKIGSAVLSAWLAFVAAARGESLSVESASLSQKAREVGAVIKVRQESRREEKEPAPPPSPPSPPSLAAEDLALADAAGAHHARHSEIFGKYAAGTAFNGLVLKAIDGVSKKAKAGDEYFMDVHAKPPESPISFELKLGPASLNPSRKRKSSFCTGASYAAFIETLNLLYPAGPPISAERLEALMMEEKDGGRREDGVKFWGKWNADDFGAYYALVNYSGMGAPVKPEDARAGDFMTIAWKDEKSHSVVFLGWVDEKKNGKAMLIWSSQKSTDGVGDYLVPLSRVAGVKLVRLTQPAGIETFDPEAPQGAKPSWERGNWFAEPKKPAPSPARRRSRR